MDEVRMNDAPPSPPAPLSRRQIAARRNGRLGGIRRAEKLWEASLKTQISPKQFAVRIAGQKGGRATSNKYGPEFCRERARKLAGGEVRADRTLLAGGGVTKRR